MVLCVVVVVARVGCIGRNLVVSPVAGLVVCVRSVLEFGCDLQEALHGRYSRFRLRTVHAV